MTILILTRLSRVAKRPSAAPISRHELVSCVSMGSLVMNSLWLIEADPHRGGSITLNPVTTRSHELVASCR